MSWNPAWAGLENSLAATGSWRQQWNGLADGPVTQQFSAHLPIAAIRSGAGVALENDALGPMRTTGGQLAISHQLQIGKKTTLSVGLSGGLQQLALDGSVLRTPEGVYIDPANPQHNDQNLPLGKEQATGATFGAGLFLLAGEWRAGAAVRQVLAPAARLGQNLNFQSRREYSIGLSRAFGLKNDWRLRPSLLIRSDFSEMQLDAAAELEVTEKWSGGLGFRGFSKKTTDALTFFVTTKINERTRLAYAYDAGLSALKTAHRGSHEVVLAYNLGKPIGEGRLPPRVSNPRFW